jgi:hypothetical protein
MKAAAAHIADVWMAALITITVCIGAVVQMVRPLCAIYAIKVHGILLIAILHIRVVGMEYVCMAVRMIINGGRWEPIAAKKRIGIISADSAVI